MIPNHDPIFVGEHQRQLRVEAERERLAAMARRRRPSGEGWLAARIRVVGGHRLGRLLAAAR